MVGPDAYQEFVAGTIPVKDALAVATPSAMMVVVEHERGFLPRFDEHLERVRAGGAPSEAVDYQATWGVITASAGRPSMVRLELSFAGLNCRPRLRFEGPALSPLWLLAEGAQLGLVIDPPPRRELLPCALTWSLGCAAGSDELPPMLERLNVPRPPPLPGRA